MTLLPLTTCAQALGVHPKTLHQWLKEAGVPLVAHPTDARIKCLTQHHLSLVARLHDRSLPEPACVPALPGEQAPSLPPTRAAEPDLMEKLSGLEARVTNLQEQLAGLALVLLQERECTLERRMAALETLTAERLGRPPSSSEGQTVVPTLSPAAVPHMPRALNPAELRARARLIPLIEYGACGAYVVICPQEGALPLIPDSPEWFGWLASLSSFRFVGQLGRFTAAREIRRSEPTRQWAAVRGRHNRTYKCYLGLDFPSHDFLS